MEKEKDSFEKRDEKDEKIIDLEETVDLPAPDAPNEDDDVIDLLNAVEPGETDDNILDLTDTVAMDTHGDDDAVDLLNAVEPDEADDDVLDLTDTIELDNLGDDDVVDLMDTVEPSEEPEEIIDLTDSADETLEETIALAESPEEIPAGTDDMSLDLSEWDGEEAEERISEDAPAVSIPRPTDDQEILELIDDIQSTLDESETAGQETTDPPSHDEVREVDEEPAETVDAREGPSEQTIYLEKGAPIDADVMAEIETDLLDNLGIDLTTELERNVLSDEEDAASVAPDAPFEAADSTLGERVETIVERVLQEKLDEILERKIADAVARELDKRMP